MVFCIVKYLKTPKVIIVYRNGELYFPEFSCKPRELENIELKRMAVNKYRNRDRNNILSVTYGGREYKYYYVSKPTVVLARLTELKTEDRIKNQ